MIRTLITIVLPLLTPSIVYLCYLTFVRKRALAAGETPPAFGEGPWGWLALAGIALACAAFAALAVYGSSTGGDWQYQPPRMEDGRIVPGRTIPSQ